MLYVFEDFELDADQIELRQRGLLVPVEPQVFTLLLLLVENRDRMVSKDEIIEKVWEGRIVSDAAISSRIKSARRALGDDGKSQRYIRTVHGQGLRFVASASAMPRATAPPAEPRVSAPMPTATSRPSIAVLPFGQIGSSDPASAIGEALPHDLITALSRLRWLFVIARGSSFRLRSAEPDVRSVGRLLDVSYCLTGAVETSGRDLAVSVELADTRSGQAIWGERFSGRADEIHEIRARIAASIVSTLEIQIPLNEATLASLAAPGNLDVWSSYHLGLKHLYRFNRKDNALAAALFEQALAQEPRFARANAGLSSAYFQSAFLRYSADPSADAVVARRFAERGVEIDPLDPFANFTMGRAFWLAGDVEGSRAWLDRSTELCPNYAQGFYARAWADAISERGVDGANNVYTAMSLSPLDPFLYAMLATHALTCLIRGDADEAAAWADRAARSPGAHVLISLIALIAHELKGEHVRSAIWAADVRGRRPDVSQAHFFASFPFREGELRRSIAKALANHGF